MATKKRIFYPHKYYVATSENLVYTFDTLDEAKSFADEDEVVLIALSSHKTTKVTPPKVTPKASKIVIDFDKKLLTIYGNCVILNKVEYSVGESEIDDDELKEWDTIVFDANKNSDEVQIVGTPPIDAKDITNEMSDL